MYEQLFVRSSVEGSKEIYFVVPVDVDSLPVHERDLVHSYLREVELYHLPEIHKLYLFRSQGILQLHGNEFHFLVLLALIGPIDFQQGPQYESSIDKVLVELLLPPEVDVVDYDILDLFRVFTNKYSHLL